MRAEIWKHLRDALSRLWRRSLRGPNERRTTRARARFWAELRAGEREAAIRSRH